MHIENPQKAPPRFRPSFTLVELLVAIAIMGVLVGMVLYSLAGAQTDAKIARTRGTIEKLNAILLQEWEAFRYRAARIELDNDLLRPMRSPNDPNLRGQPPLSPREGARLRMIVLRDLMRMEMPDRLTDILYPPTIYKAALLSGNNRDGVTNDDQPYWVGNWDSNNARSSPYGRRVVPGKLNNYRSKLNFAFQQLGVQLTVGAFASPFAFDVAPSPALDAIPNDLGQRTTLLQNQPAEMLYMIVAQANYQGGPSLEAFRPTEIGDTDEDGLPEFLDAWGNPIRWIRWPSGFPSPLNTPYNPASNAGNSDAMDPIRTDWRWQSDSYAVKPWLLVPLVVSAGPDEVFDIAFDSSTPLVFATQQCPTGTNSPAHTAQGPYYFPDPYFGSYDGSGAYTGAGLGSLIDTDGDNSAAGATDNITNYSLILE